MNQWQPIETAPRDGSRLIVFWPRYAYNNSDTPEPFIGMGFFKMNRRIKDASAEARGNLIESYFADSDEADDYGLAYPEHQATHWMPLPAVPQ